MDRNAEPYFLRTERLGFRLWREEDLPLAIGLWGDPYCKSSASNTRTTSTTLRPGCSIRRIFFRRPGSDGHDSSEAGRIRSSAVPFRQRPDMIQHPQMNAVDDGV